MLHTQYFPIVAIFLYVADTTFSCLLQWDDSVRSIGRPGASTSLLLMMISVGADEIYVGTWLGALA